LIDPAILGPLPARRGHPDVLVLGGGLGGMAAALAAAERGARVLLTEETDWLGGQLTSQAVPPDEHPWIERFGCTARYRALRDGIRAHYREHYPLTAAARSRRDLNPGSATVSRLACEPRAALAVIEAMVRRPEIELLLERAPVAAEVDRDRVVAVTLSDGRVVEAEWVIDATETGELLPLCGAEHVTGAESREQTGEPHAAPRADPLNMQPVTACFAVDHLPGEDHTIPRPPGYEPGRFSLVAPDPRTNEPVERTLSPNPPGDPAVVGPDLADPTLDKELWLFRRIAARGNFEPGLLRSDITLVNWPQVDYVGGPVYGVPDAARHAAAARELSLCFLYWLQTEAGLPGLRLRGDVVGDTPDGLAKALYIRESRRIAGERMVLEHELGADYPDTVGIGQYRIDLHPSTGGDPYVDVPCPPFQIPLGALVPVRIDNLLAGAKNIATTHVTNGAYRLHPVEWGIGEAAGHLAAFCTAHRTLPRAVRAGPLLASYQRELEGTGVELRWPAGASTY
jgi:glycine/D-amino acid oxidase-like deaminating enzyme